MSVFGTWLQAELDARGWDARRCAQAVGVKDNTVHYWLSGQKRPSVANVIRLAVALHLPVEDVLRRASYGALVEKVAPLSADEATKARAEVLAALPQFADVIEIMASEPPDRQAVQIEIIRRLLLSRPVE